MTYQKTSNKIKAQMLEELSAILHMNRQYLASLLKNIGKVILRKGKFLVVGDPTLKEFSKRGRKKVMAEI